ncbi:MAG: hypothetical protein R2799_10085 [Crocinitomicaceae bacterium]
MTNIKFERNRKMPSDQELLKHKNFDTVLKGYQAGSAPTKWFNSAKLWGGIVATACIAGVGLYLWTSSSSNDSKSEQTSIEENSTTEMLNQDLSEIYQSHTEQFDIDPSKDTILITANGSIINIPAHGFDTECKSVKIKVNEIDDPIKMFQSKIDMGYDSAGTKYHFESAGMIEIRAFGEGEEIQLAQGKEVNIALVTNTVEPSYNLYHKTEDNWDYLGDANTIFHPETIVETNQNTENTVQSENIVDSKKEIVKVGKLNPHYPTFDVDVTSHSELSTFKGLVFQVDPSEQDFQEDFYLVSWDKITLDKTENNYYINLARGGTKYRFKVKPVLNQKDYQNYLAKNKNSQTFYDQMSNRQKQYKQEFKQQNFVFDYDKKAQSYMVSNAVNQEVKYMVAAKSRRLFGVQTLGVINCDHVLPEAIKDQVELAQFFYKKGNESMTPEVTYVIIPGINTLFTFEGNGMKYYAKEGKTKVWVIIDGKIGIVNESQKQNFETVALYDAKQGISKIEEYCSN